MRWQFTPLAWSAAPERCRALEQWRSAGEVMEAVVASAVTKKPPGWEPRDKPPTAAGRLQVILTADAAAVDALFNSRHGYRAAFARSPQDGEAFNRRIVSMLVDGSGLPLDPRMLESAADEAAKVWMQQDCRQHAAMTKRAIYPAELDVQDWSSRMDESVDTSRGMRWFARAGVLLGPVNGIIQIKGGWRFGGRSWPDPEKRARSIQLHRFGFT